MWGKLLAGAGALALAAFLVWMFGNARYDAGKLAERDRWKDRQIKTAVERGAMAVGYEKQLTRAAEDYANRTAAMQPIIVRSTNTVERYAETPAGRALCLTPDRVLGIERDAAALFAATAGAAEGAGGTLPDNAAQETGGRRDEQRRR